MIHPNDESEIKSFCEAGLTDYEIARKTGYTRGEVQYWRSKNGLINYNSKPVSYKIALTPEQQPKMRRFLSLAAAIKPAGGVAALMKAIREESQCRPM